MTEIEFLQERIAILEECVSSFLNYEYSISGPGRYEMLHGILATSINQANEVDAKRKETVDNENSHL